MKVMSMCTTQRFVAEKNVLVVQRPITIVENLAHHCATPLQQPELHLTMMSITHNRTYYT